MVPAAAPGAPHAEAEAWPGPASGCWLPIASFSVDWFSRSTGGGSVAELDGLD